MSGANKDKLKRGMESRHLIMMAIGGTISAGFFLGTGSILSSVGALGTILAFLFGGLVMFLALLSLTEMAAYMPVSGSFQYYATKFISPLAGFMTGWLYLLNWVTAAAASLAASSIIMVQIFPNTSAWLWSLLFIVILFVLNLFPVKLFGEMEFWFAGIKIAAILLFIFIGAAIVFGMFPHFGPIIGFKNYYVNGWFPNGIVAFLYGLIIVVYSYQGAELIGIAAGESKNPDVNVKKSIKSVGLRILLFFVLSVFIVTLLLPWNLASTENSPFIVILQQAQIPYVYGIMQIVVIVAGLSSVNSAFYACTRLLWSMAKSKQAPNFYAHTNRFGVPIWSLLLTAVLSGICLLSKFIGEEKIFLLIVSASGSIGCLIWIIISWSHIKFRAYLKKEGIPLESLPFRIRFFPAIPIASIVLNIVVLFGLFCDPSQRFIIYSGAILIIVFAVIYYISFRKKLIT
jgi:arginine/ornithine permease